MKQMLLKGLLALLALTLCCLPALAEEAASPLKYTMELSTNRFTGPADITVTIKVTNDTDTDMPGPVALYYPDGTMVQEFGSPTLAAGQTQSWTGTWSVTQEQLDEGRIVFALRWYTYDEEGNLKPDGDNFSKSLIYTAAAPSVEINRIITPSIAREGQEVSVTYEIVNTGTVDISNVTIRENSAVSTSNGVIEKVTAGERATYTFTVKMGKRDITSNATITYRSGNTTETARKEDAVIKYGEIKLNASVTADKKGGVAGENVKFTITLKNTGSVDYQNVTVTDAQLGEIATGQTVAAGKTVTLEKEIAITGTTDYQFAVTGQDDAGATIETATERVSVVELDPAKAVSLTVNASADRDTIYEAPSVVRFRVDVTNNSQAEAKNVSVSASGVTLYTFDTLAPGQTRSFVRDVSVSMAGQFRFDAAVRDELDETKTFESNIVTIQHLMPTAEPTSVPVQTPVPPVYRERPTSDGMPEYVNTVEKIISVFNHAFLLLAGVCAVLSIVGSVRRVQANRRAQDHLERSSARVYDMPAPKSKEKAHKPQENGEQEEEQTVTRPIGEDNEPEVPEVKPGDDVVARDGALMEETLRQLYTRDKDKETEDKKPDDQADDQA